MRKINLSKAQKKIAEEILSEFSAFKTFSRNKELAYKFTNIIGIKVCPYCNIEYIYTVYDEKGKPVFRPDIDHFVPQNAITGNPTLQLELTNLVPSCSICNERLKGNKPFSRDNYIHPYFDDFDSIIEFHISIKDLDYLNEEAFDIEFHGKDGASTADILRAKNNIQVFYLEERYAFHKDEVVSLFKRMKHYNKNKLKEIDLLLGVEKEDKNILFPEKNSEINKTSLGKLKRDIIFEYFYTFK